MSFIIRVVILLLGKSSIIGEISACIIFDGIRQKETTIFDRRLSFLLFSSLLSIRSSLFSKIVVSREKIREKREESKVV